MTRDAGPVKGGTTEIAFVEDNTGYKWELIQKPADFLGKKRDPILHVRVGSISRMALPNAEAHPAGTPELQSQQVP